MSDSKKIVSEEEVRKIADMGRLSLSEDEITQASSTISQIFGNFEIIRSLDTAGVVPADDVSGLKNITREDVVREHIMGEPEELLKNANMNNGYVQVPGVFSDTEIL